jgi:hypothetical protein
MLQQDSQLLLLHAACPSRSNLLLGLLGPPLLLLGLPSLL